MLLLACSVAADQQQLSPVNIVLERPEGKVRGRRSEPTWIVRLCSYCSSGCSVRWDPETLRTLQRLAPIADTSLCEYV